ncbi:MAG: archease [Candidatus Woesearchaeota archaeon]
MTYTFIKHTADIAFIAHAHTFEELLEQCAQAFLRILTKDTIQAKYTHSFMLQGTHEQAVYRLLEELLLQLDMEHRLCTQVQITQHNDGWLVDCWYDTIDNYTIFAGIKAITRHNLIVKKKEQWSVQVVVDV